MPTTPLPTPPSRQDPANFAARGDAFLGALPQFQEELNELQTDVATNTTAAAGSASAAATSATNAASSASSASTSATNAGNSASAAATSATAASGSATSAAVSAAAAAAALDEFTDTYLGAKSSDPTVDNDGNPLTVGDQYFNTVNNELRIYNGSAWQSASTVGGTINTLAVNTSAALNYGTANGVNYLNGSKVITSSSGFTYDGANLRLAGGNVQLGNAYFLTGRNAANTGDIPIVRVDSGNSLEFGAGGYSSTFTGKVQVGTYSQSLSGIGWSMEAGNQGGGGVRGNITSLNELFVFDNIGGATYQIDFRQNNTEVGSINVNSVSSGVEFRTGSGGVNVGKSGIYFASTQLASSDANCLDDYEEGSWTIGLRGSTTAGSYTVTGSCKYTKVGNVVTVTASIDALTVNSAGAGYAQITGLPFTKATGGLPQGAAYLNYVAFPSGTDYLTFSPITGSATDTWYFAGVKSGTLSANVDVTSFTGSTTGYFSATYFAST